MTLIHQKRQRSFKKQDIMLNKILKSLIIKKKFIEIDEFDKDREIYLIMFVHSFGHAIEKSNKF